MPRLFVMSDNLSARVEVFNDPITERFAALCVGCNRDRSASALADLLDGERAAFNLEDAIEEVVIPHADSCLNCADDACMIPTRHERGHRCRRLT